jgi:hypothetical protein
MNKPFLVLLLLLIMPAAAAPQRYGRPFSLAEAPTLLLEVRVQNRSHYFRPADLRKLQRCVVTQNDPATKTSHVYEGVALEQLLPGTNFALQGQRIEIEFGSHQTAIISGTDLDLRTKPMIVDKVDGNFLSGHTPYYFLAKSQGKAVEALADVQRVVLEPPK